MGVMFTNLANELGHNLVSFAVHGYFMLLFHFSKESCRIKLYLVGGFNPTPLKNMSSSVGMILAIYMESHKSHVPKPPSSCVFLN
jgi:hypothetical protein